MKIIGLSGYAQSGKDTTAEILAELGYERIAFADILRDFLYAMNPRIWEGQRVQNTVDQIGWDQAKVAYDSEIRGLLQRLGTDAGRKYLGENVWVDAALKGLEPDGLYVVTDCRFVNEADGIRKRTGKVYRIHRQGVGPINDHISERGLDDYDFDGYLFNNGTVAEFKDQVLKEFS